MQGSHKVRRQGSRHNTHKVQHCAQPETLQPWLVPLHASDAPTVVANNHHRLLDDGAVIAGGHDVDAARLELDKAHIARVDDRSGARDKDDGAESLRILWPMQMLHFTFFLIAMY